MLFRSHRLAFLLRRVDQRPHLPLQRLHPNGVGPRRLEALPRVGQGERMVRMAAAVDEERGELSAERRGRVVDGVDGVGQPEVPVVLSA